MLCLWWFARFIHPESILWLEVLVQNLGAHCVQVIKCMGQMPGQSPNIHWFYALLLAPTSLW